MMRPVLVLQMQKAPDWSSLLEELERLRSVTGGDVRVCAINPEIFAENALDFTHVVDRD